MKASERHRLKQDAYADGVARAVVWMKKHQTRLVAVLVAALVVVIGVMWVIASKRSAAAMAQSELAELDKQIAAIAGMPKTTACSPRRITLPLARAIFRCVLQLRSARSDPV